MEFLFVSRYSLVNLILHPYCGRFKKEGKKGRGKKKTSILPHFCREGMIFINLREMGQCYRESLERVNRCRSHKGYDLFQERRNFYSYIFGPRVHQSYEEKFAAKKKFETTFIVDSSIGISLESKKRGFFSFFLSFSMEHGRIDFPSEGSYIFLYSIDSTPSGWILRRKRKRCVILYNAVDGCCARKAQVSFNY